MHNVKKSFKRLLAVSLCASCVLSNGMLSLAEGAEDKAVNLALGFLPLPFCFLNATFLWIPNIFMQL